MTSHNNKEEDSHKKLAPLYVKGLLGGIEQKEFETVLRASGETANEVKQWQEIRDAYAEIEADLPGPPAGLYARIAGNIKKKNRTAFWERLLPAPAFSFALIACQFILILGMAAYIASSKSDYTTLSAPPERHTVERINVVFREEATEAEIRELLIRTEARMVAGPSISGLYVIEITGKRQLQDTLTNLKKSKLVLMAEKAY